jgi:uncharacterized protein YkwD
MKPRYIIAAIVTILVVILGLALYFSYKATNDATIDQTAKTVQPTKQFDEAEKAKLYQEIGAYRSEKNVPAFKIDSRLEVSAGKKAQDLVDRDYWSNVSPSGDTPSDLILQEGYNHVYAGESLSSGPNTASQIINGWKNSSQTNENLVNPVITSMGLGYSCKSGGACIVALHLATEEVK